MIRSERLARRALESVGHASGYATRPAADGNPATRRKGVLSVTWAVLCTLACGPEDGAQGARPAQVRFEGGAGTPGVQQVDLTERRAAQREVEVWEPYEERNMRFVALPALPLLDELLGATWREADELVFTCADGYRAAVPVSRFVEHRAFFAIGRVEADFAIDKPVGGAITRTPLAPAYLIWENVDDAQVRSEGDWGWPYQVVGISIAARAAERYARMAPPAGAPDDAVRGFAVFRRYCTRCHAINGEGGQVGPELNYPASVSEYIEPTWLRRWVDSPQQVRHGTPMPGLPQGIPEREQALTDVLAYLNAMAQRKLARAPTAPAPEPETETP